LNVSQLQVVEDSQVAVAVAKAAGQKCERCWHWETDVGSQAEHPTLCRRCLAAI
jgi:isoleucyl-tRNA synthetase